MRSAKAAKEDILQTIPKISPSTALIYKTMEE